MSTRARFGLVGIDRRRLARNPSHSNPRSSRRFHRLEGLGQGTPPGLKRDAPPNRCRFALGPSRSLPLDDAKPPRSLSQIDPSYAPSSPRPTIPERRRTTPRNAGTCARGMCPTTRRAYGTPFIPGRTVPRALDRPRAGGVFGASGPSPQAKSASDSYLCLTFRMSVLMDSTPGPRDSRSLQYRMDRPNRVSPELEPRDAIWSQMLGGLTTHMQSRAEPYCLLAR